jgi:hypothetical protein
MLRFFLKGVFMCFTKNAKPLALFAAILVLFAVSCATQTVTSPAPVVETGPRLAGRVGNFTEEQLSRIGQVPAGALAGLTTGSPALDYTFPAFLDGIWGEAYGDSFHLEDGNPIGYTISGWTPQYGWVGEFQAVYYFDEDNPEDRGLILAEMTTAYIWCLTPPWSSGYRISATYYQRINDDRYYLINLAKELPAPDPNFPGYTYGQPMYETIADALYELIDEGALDDMLLSYTAYDRQ